jgi:hypothetical protein
MGQNSRQPLRVAARIGAGVVARLADILDIACIERLAITNSGSNAHVFYYIWRSKSSCHQAERGGKCEFIRGAIRS